MAYELHETKRVIILQYCFKSLSHRCPFYEFALIWTVIKMDGYSMYSPRIELNNHFAFTLPLECANLVVTPIYIIALKSIPANSGEGHTLSER